MDHVIEHSIPTTATASDGERHWAATAHLAALVLALMTSWMAGLAGVLAASVVYLFRPMGSEYVGRHAREAINFNLSMFLYTCLAALLGVVLLSATVLTLGIGALVTIPAALVLLVLMALIALMWFVCSLIATVRAWNGEEYRYPLTLRLFR